MFKVSYDNVGVEFNNRTEAIVCAVRASWESRNRRATVVHSDGIFVLEKWEYDNGKCVEYKLGRQQRYNDTGVDE